MSEIYEYFIWGITLGIGIGMLIGMKIVMYKRSRR